MKDLHQLLKQWNDIEPAGNFEANVWRRIRLAQPAPAPALADWLRAWLPRPVLALAAAVVAGVIIGAWSGLFSVPTRSTEQLSFLGRDTLAGILQR